MPRFMNAYELNTFVRRCLLIPLYLDKTLKLQRNKKKSWKRMKKGNISVCPFLLKINFPYFDM